MKVYERYLISEASDREEWSWDGAEIDPSDFDKLLKTAGFRGRKANLDRKSQMYIWLGDGVTIYTGRDPYTGEGTSKYQSQNEPGDMGYLGVVGDGRKVNKIVSMFQKMGTWDKEYSGVLDYQNKHQIYRPTV